MAEVSYSPQFQTALTRDYGTREGDYLRRDVEQSVRAAIERRHVSTNGITIEVSIVDARPNSPTMQQLAHRPGLDPILSFSVGGAELTAVLRNANGQQVAEVRHRKFNYSIDDVYPPTSTWHEAQYAIDQFAEKVADAYAAQAH
jgi:hypothetical protein